MAVPAYLGVLTGYFYEVVWTWNGVNWVRGRDEVSLNSYQASNPCGAFNPLGLEPWFYKQPPYRLYEVWRWINNNWVRCLTLRNWQ